MKFAIFRTILLTTAVIWNLRPF